MHYTKNKHKIVPEMFCQNESLGLKNVFLITLKQTRWLKSNNLNKSAAHTQQAVETTVIVGV